MTSIDAYIAPSDRGDQRGTDELLEDWLGLAGYLAAAVADGHIALQAAGVELAAEATGLVERRALHRAADVAATQLGADSLVTALLRSATGASGDVA
jgi:hypothetical protein